MGLAASQGRLLLLTARKSDLEFQAQKISQERLLLAMQQEQISNEYSDKINNQVWQVFSPSTNGYETVTSQSLQNFFGSVKTAKVTGTGEATDYRVPADKLEIVGSAASEITSDTINIPNNTVVTLTAGSTETSHTIAAGSTVQVGGVTYRFKENIELPATNVVSGSYNDSPNWQIKDMRSGNIITLDDAMSGTSPDSFLQMGLGDSNFLMIQKKNADGVFEDFSLTNSGFRQAMYTEDDAAAKSKYDAAMARVQRLDKQLELKLNQVETQKKAVETEIESVNKIITSNIEGSFKYFS